MLSGAGLEEATQVVPSALRGGTTTARVPPRYGGRYYDYEEAVPRRPLWPWLLATLLLALAGLAGYFVYREVDHRLSASASVSVPYVQGITEGLAIDKLKKAGLTYKVVRRPNEKAAIGNVFDQNPNGGDHAGKGDQVVIYVSTGKPKVEVPDVRQDSLTDAVKALTQLGLNYKEYDVPSSLAPGTVTGQAPPPGTMVVKGTTVRINVSKGLPPIVIPSDVIGQTQDAATSELQGLGFNVQAQETDSTKPKGTVVDTNPKPSASAPRGSAVTIYVSKGPQTAFVPDVRGFGVANAVATIRAAGFKAVVQRQDTSDQTQDGVVISESPEQNTQAALGSPVTINVGHYVPPSPTGPTGPGGPSP